MELWINHLSYNRFRIKTLNYSYFKLDNCEIYFELVELWKNRVRINCAFLTWNDRNLAKIWQKLSIKWNFKLTMFESTCYVNILISKNTQLRNTMSSRLSNLMHSSLLFSLQLMSLSATLNLDLVLFKQTSTYLTAGTIQQWPILWQVFF